MRQCFTCTELWALWQLQSRRLARARCFYETLRAVVFMNVRLERNILSLVLENRWRSAGGMTVLYMHASAKAFAASAQKAYNFCRIESADVEHGSDWMTANCRWPLLSRILIDSTGKIPKNQHINVRTSWSSLSWDLQSFIPLATDISDRAINIIIRKNYY